MGSWALRGCLQALRGRLQALRGCLQALRGRLQALRGRLHLAFAREDSDFAAQPQTQVWVLSIMSRQAMSFVRAEMLYRYI